MREPAKPSDEAVIHLMQIQEGAISLYLRRNWSRLWGADEHVVVQVVGLSDWVSGLSN